MDETLLLIISNEEQNERTVNGLEHVIWSLIFHRLKFPKSFSPQTRFEHDYKAIIL